MPFWVEVVGKSDALKQTFSSIYFGTMHRRAGVNIGVVSLFPIKETNILKDAAYCSETNVSSIKIDHVYKQHIGT